MYTVSYVYTVLQERCGPLRLEEEDGASFFWHEIEIGKEKVLEVGCGPEMSIRGSVP